jgi:predicted RNA-binding Zn ribbon-like protein
MGDPTTTYAHKLVGGALCLDFVNTVSGRVSSGRRVAGREHADRILVERLQDWTNLVDWLVRAEALDADGAVRLHGLGAASPVAAARVLSRAVRLREALYRIFKAAVEGWAPPDADLERLNRESGALRAEEALLWTGVRLERRWRGEDGLAYPLWLVLRSAEDLLTSDALGRVGQCPGDDCGWLFLDTSRGRRRRWCDMADCGNLAKVRRHRRRVRRANG